jgi:hypothetical protein
MKVRWGLVFLGAIAALVLGFTIPFLPWIKPEITEDGTVVASKPGRCSVETDSKNVIEVDGCDKKVGERLTIKYRETTKIGELVP